MGPDAGKNEHHHRVDRQDQQRHPQREIDDQQLGVAARAVLSLEKVHVVSVSGKGFANRTEGWLTPSVPNACTGCRWANQLPVRSSKRDLGRFFLFRLLDDKELGGGRS